MQLHDIVLAISKDGKNNILLLGKSQCEHDYRISKSDVDLLNSTKIFFYQKSRDFDLIKKLDLHGAILSDINLKDVKNSEIITPSQIKSAAQIIAKQLCDVERISCNFYQKNLKEFAGQIDKQFYEMQQRLKDIKDVKYLFYYNIYEDLESFLKLKSNKGIITNPHRSLNLSDVRTISSLVKDGKLNCIIFDSHDENEVAKKLANNYNIKSVKIDFSGGEMRYSYLYPSRVFEAIARCKDSSYTISNLK